MSDHTIILWFRRDLRLTDNPALTEAIKTGARIIPIFIWSPEEEAPWQPGSASKWWLHHSLKRLQHTLQQCGSQLILLQGSAIDTLSALIQQTDASGIYLNRRYELWASKQEKDIQTHFLNRGIPVKGHKANLLFEPWTIQNRANKPFQVFSAYWRHCLTLLGNEPILPKPQQIPAPDQWPPSLTLEDLRLAPRLQWADGIQEVWIPGEEAAQVELMRFLQTGFSHYDTGRDIPAISGTSRLSPYLHFGEISSKQIYRAIQYYLKKEDLEKRTHRSAEIYVKELGWREFSHHLLYHFPHTSDAPLKAGFNRLPWQKNEVLLKAWQHGQTGYPIVDAGMRELWHSGWMHNRVRMIVASFLTKDLMIPWQEGARWFWDTLVDADLANNTLGWQWTSGCGADAAPYFRVFNPVLQGEKFDPDGLYVKHWLPELAKLPRQWVHKPWQAPPTFLKEAGITLGKTYPLPLIDHTYARNRALKAFQQMKEKSEALDKSAAQDMA